MLPNQIVGAGIVVFGLVVGALAIIWPLNQLVLLIITYLRTILGNPIKTAPLSEDDLTRRV